MEYSQEQMNYFRLCYVAFNVVPVGLRQIFKKNGMFGTRQLHLENGKIQQKMVGIFTTTNPQQAKEKILDV